MLTYILVGFLVCILLSSASILYMRLRPTLAIYKGKKLLKNGIFYGYTKCNFQGKSFTGNSDDQKFVMTADEYNPIQSIIVPDGVKIMTYKDPEGVGPQYNYVGPTIIPCGLEIRRIVGKKA